MVMVIMIVPQYLLEKNLYNKQNFTLQLARTTKEHKMLDKNEQKFQGCQILKQKFDDVSVFEIKF